MSEWDKPSVLTIVFKRESLIQYPPIYQKDIDDVLKKWHGIDFDSA